jgi:hypothetical protein
VSWSELETPLLPDSPEGRLDDLIETAKAHIRAKVEHPFRVIKRQFGFQRTRLRGMINNRCKVNVLAALANPFTVRHQLLCWTGRVECGTYLGAATALNASGMSPEMGRSGPSALERSKPHN